MITNHGKERNSFPGTEGGAFDLIVKFWDWIEKIHWLVFLTGLALLALLVSGGNLRSASMLFIFFLLDYLLLSGLPRLRISFGPPKPPTLMLSILRLPFVLLPLWINLIFQVLGTVLVIYGFWIEPQKLKITRQSLSTPGFKPSRPVRVFHFGDLHFEHMTRREARLQQVVSELHPDIILFSGDFLSYSYTYDKLVWEEVNNYLKGFSAPLGVFCVSGSPPVDPDEVLGEILTGTRFTRLHNEKRKLEFLGQQIDLIGLDCSHNPDQDLLVLMDVLDDSEAGLKILLYHSPDLAPDAARAGVHLQLSGHTHGGQVRLPLIGALYAASLYGKRFESGRYGIGDMVLYVTRGLGLEGKGAPRVRFLCPPEAVLWEIG